MTVQARLAKGLVGMISRILKVVLSSLAAIFLFGCPALAQQITYYTFDGASGNSSYGCYDPAVDLQNAANNSLLCLNDYNATAFGTGANPSFQSVPYPDGLGGGTHADMLMNPSQTSQSENVWFSVPQKVSNGFTAYFAFKLTPDPASYATADGIAFVLQNAQGGGALDPDTSCQEKTSGNFSPAFTVTSGPNVVSGGGGGCIGYSGIDNSLAVEFDTYADSYDPNANHIAIQNCGTGVNSSSHFGENPCLIHDDATPSLEAINESPGVTLADGNIHQAVVEYSGALGTPANQLQIFIDPQFVTGTHTPVAGSVPAISVIYNIANHMNLLGGDSAYIGFSAATGAADETQELLSWTYTPHTPVTQQQPLQQPGTQTTFPFGAHTYAVTYPSDGPSTTGIDMIVVANTITPANFATLVGPTSFAGSQCQIYEGTGGNCVIYSVYCVTDGTSNKVACPATSDPTIAVKTAYESDNTVPPVSPGFLQGDPFYAPVSNISGDGTTATVSCTGECSVSVGQTVTIANNLTSGSPSGFNGTYQVASISGVDSFTFASTATVTGTGGYITSNNVLNICNGPTDPIPCWQPAKIDGTTAGKTKNFSDLVALSLTVNIVNTSTAIAAPAITYGNPAQITVTVSPVNGTGPVTGNVTLTVDGNSLAPQALSGGSAVFSVPGLTGGSHSLSASYAAQGNFGASNTTSSVMVSTIAPTVTFTGAPVSAAYQAVFTVAATTNASTSPQITSSGACSNSGLVVTMTSGTGTCALSATWTADTNYSGVTLTQFTAATKINPVISWTPAPIQLGTVLTAAQLDASANVPGLFSYTPPLGTVVVSGQQVTALFTPTASANYNTASAKVTLSVTAGAVATVSPSSIDFGTLYLGAVVTKNVTVTNNGNAAMTISGPFLSIVKGGDSHEFVEVNLCPKSLAAGKSCVMTVAFLAGPYYTPQTATLSVMDSAPGSPQTVGLTATVINPQATLSTNSLSFGNQKTGTPSAAKIVTVKNTGGTLLTINSVAVTGANIGDFPIMSGCGSTLTAGASCSISVVFDPASKTSRSATLTIKDNALTSPQTVPLSGKGN